MDRERISNEKKHITRRKIRRQLGRISLEKKRLSRRKLVVN